MKKEWKNIEGRLARIDVGSSLSEAMGSTFPAEAICFTTDGNIVFNGIQYSLSQDEYNALAESIKANTEAIAKKVDKKEGYDLASLDQLRAAQWCSEHVLSDNTATSFLKVVEDGKNGYKFNHLVDGETYNSTPQYIPVATDSTSGVMSASDHSSFTEALEDIDTLFSELGSHDKAIADNATSIQANTEAIAKNATDIKACQDSIANANGNAKSVLQISTSLVLPFSGTIPFRITVEGVAKDAQWNEAYGNLPQYSSAFNAFFISSGLKNYVAWEGFTDIPDSSCYGSTKTLYYDGEKLYRYTGTELVELTTSTQSDTTALEERVKTLETQLASVISLLTLQQ